jgi:hypothetical protein
VPTSGGWRWTIPTGRPCDRDASAAEGVAASARSIEAIRALDAGRGLVRPIVTPRFTPACMDTSSRRGSLRIWPELDTPERVLEKIVRLAGPPDILGVWVDGRRVVGG